MRFKKPGAKRFNEVFWKCRGNAAWRTEPFAAWPNGCPVFRLKVRSHSFAHSKERANIAQKTVKIRSEGLKTGWERICLSDGGEGRINPIS